ncbi:hypothetical protein ACFL2F_04805 [Myxococcota bacterium]
MRRLLTVLLVLLTALSLVLVSSCRKRTVKDTAEEEDTNPSPGDPPLPGHR